VSIQALAATELVALDHYNPNEQEAHIVLDKAICRKCQEKPCLVVCPAVLYTLDKNGDINFDYVGCLECGTCRVMCKDKGIIKWEYPLGGFGVNFRFG